MKVLRIAVLTVVSTRSLVGCDLCSVYSASESRGELGKGAYVGVAEQFTHYGTWQFDGQPVPNPSDEFLDSSITQLLLGYNFTERFGVQFNIPIIARSYRRLVGHALRKGEENGLSDVSVLGHAQLFRYETKHATLSWTLLGGLKFPTGSSSRLLEEVAEHQAEADPGHHEHPSGVHGHDLTLGSGSLDGIMGTTIYARRKRFFFSASVQYAIRTAGDYDYRFANNVLWSGGPGWIPWLSDQFTLTLQANCTGENKSRDTFMGEKAEDTGITSVYLGPELVAAWGGQWSAELAADFPVSIDNTALQIVPGWRLRAAVTLHF